MTLCDAPNGRGGSWGEDGTIVFAPTCPGWGSFLRVSSAGGTPEPLTTVGDGEITQRWPQLLPGGKAVLYTGHSSRGDFRRREPRRATAAGGRAQSRAAGRLLWPVSAQRTSGLHPRRDALRRAVRSRPAGADRPAGARARRRRPSNALTGGAHSRCRTTARWCICRERASTAELPIQWMDRDGKTMPLAGHARELVQSSASRPMADGWP